MNVMILCVFFGTKNPKWYNFLITAARTYSATNFICVLKIVMYSTLYLDGMDRNVYLVWLLASKSMLKSIIMPDCDISVCCHNVVQENLDRIGENR